MGVEERTVEFTVETAAMIARLAHWDQFDAGDPSVPYVAHPAAVYGLLVGSVDPYSDDPYAQMLAWLHDVVEDTWVTMEALRIAGCPEEVCRDLDAITKRKGESRDDYYSRIMKRPRAWAVKVYDVQHNSQPDRLAAVARRDEVRARRMAKKYEHAKDVLGSGPPRIVELQS